MNLRRFLVIGLVLVFVAAPGVALACEVGCSSSDVGTAGEKIEACHPPAHDELSFGPRLAGSHDCSQHAAFATAPLKTESNRAAGSQQVALTINVVYSDRPSSGEAISNHDLAPPGSSSRLIAPLRI